MPSTHTNSRNISNQNFEIAILFSVVERSGKYVFDNPRTFSRSEDNFHFTEKKAMDCQFSIHILIHTT